MKTINKLFFSVLIFSIFSFLFVSCEKDTITIDNQVEAIDSPSADLRSVSDAEVNFRLHLNNLSDMFHIANDSSNGDLALLLVSFEGLSNSEAFEELYESSLISVGELQIVINRISYYEGLLLASYSSGDIENIVNEEVGHLQGLIPNRPFWGVGCDDYIGIVGMPDDKCYHMYVDCRQFHFFIGGAQVADQLVETECPEDDHS